MALLPEEIEGKRFLVALRGYDKDQVHAFLALVADEHRALLEGNAPGGVALERDPATALGERVASIIRAAIASAEEIRAAAQEEASRIVAAAEEERIASRRERDEARDELRAAEALRREAAKINRAAAEEAARIMEAAQQELEAAIELRSAEAQQVDEPAAPTPLQPPAGEGNGASHRRGAPAR